MVVENSFSCYAGLQHDIGKIGVADAYDAMTSNRSYRNAMSQEKVRSEIEKGKGSQFDPVFADIMLEVDEDIKTEIYG